MKESINITLNEKGFYDLVIRNGKGVTILRDHGDLEPMMDILYQTRQDLLGNEFPEKTFWYYGMTSEAQMTAEKFKYAEGDIVDW
jgi:hypothetical protein